MKFISHLIHSTQCKGEKLNHGIPRSLTKLPFKENVLSEMSSARLALTR